ncbi:transporter substrate-binding domain-containing diguanylate cyclase [Marinobacter orientalis]|uniref:Transporter substrate-binding domain-containing protein n=1 Tax=Marinobacter orientalis TaxID=1928859 RepID=A0A7Y0RAZ1_9GAMM|nr:transporter substrate-binding domain-containing protein [Marinobacter orientalis]NMT62563.1 transporter substrate-binding domain-containing protein [Marinobacter orientalis]TGX51256.1 transporter substrate-binding domain-containing protein [Marinobacter orientalis]
MSAGIAWQRPSLNQLSHAMYAALVLIALSFPVWSADRQTVSVGIVADNKPYSNIEGRTPSGFSIDVLREVARQADLTLEFRAGTWPEIYGAFLHGDIDVIEGISYQEERARSIQFTDPYHIRQTYVMHDPANPLTDVSSLDALSGSRIGVVRDVYYRDMLTDAGIELITYDSIPSLVRALAFGWVDGIIGPELTLRYYANQAGFRFLEIVGHAPMGELAREDFRLGVLKENGELFKVISNGLKAVPEARITELFERWQEYGGASIAESQRFSFSNAHRRYISEIGPVRVGFMRDYAPFSFHDAGTLQGLSMDVMDRISDITGLQVVPVAGQWSELYPIFLAGDLDIMANISRTTERLENVRFTRPYHIIPNVAFTLEENLQFNIPGDLAGLRVAIGAGIYYESALREELGDNVFSFISQRAMFQALAEESVDVALAALPNGNYWVRELQITGVTVAGEIELDGMSGEDLRFGVRPALEPLASIMDAALGAISPTEMRTIENRWLGASASRRPPPADAPLTFTESEQAWLAKRNRQITLCVDPDWLPLEALSDDNRHIGISADTFSLFAERADIEFTPLPVDTWAESVEAARNRQCDLFSMAMETPERLEYMSFTEPYIQIPGVLLGRVEAPFINTLDDVGDRPVGIVEGYAFKELLQTTHPDLRLVKVGNEKEGLRMVQERELAGYISTLSTASYHMQELGLADLKVLGRVPADWSLGIGARNDEPELLSIMQKLVASLTEDERTAVERQWAGIRLEQTVDYTLVFQLILGATVVLGLLFYWNRKLGGLNRELAAANDRLTYLSVTDDLTQIGNRSYFDREFSKSFHWCQRHRAGFAVAMVDADHFKTINDTYGHDAGDNCLVALADTMRTHFRRDTDRLTRFGGEEFIIFTSFSDREELISRLESFREGLAGQTITCNDQQVSFTVSIGLATGVPRKDTAPAEFLRRADKALYLAKKNGRNRLEAVVIEDSD